MKRELVTKVVTFVNKVPLLSSKFDLFCRDYLAVRENFSYDSRTNGELWMLKILAKQRLLRMVFDVGANNGGWTDLVLDANPNTSVHCFEICPPTYQKLLRNLSGKRAVTLNNFGLSDKMGDISINYCRDVDVLSSMFDLTVYDKVETINAHVTTGSDYCTSRHISQIDFLKLDVEGAEHLVLNGFGDLLTPANISVVQFEYGMVNILTRFLLKDYYSFFEARGYVVGKLYPNFVRFRKYRFTDEDFRGPNYIAAAPELAVLLERKGGY